MKRFLPDSITGRTMVVLLVGLTLSHLAGTALLSSDRHDAALAASELLSADRVAVAARLLDAAAAPERPRLARELSSPSLSVAWDTAPAITASHHDDGHLQMVAEALTPSFATVEHARLHVVHRVTPSRDRGFGHELLHGFPQDRVMEVSFRLTDGSWANFDVAMARQSALWSAHTVISTAIMIAAIFVLGAWATGWIARPLESFARAADRLGRDVAAEPLSEDGPREVRRVVVSFNEMQARIRRFVDDRTRMLAAISHDLRSPITRLRLRAEMLAEDEPRRRMLADLDEMEAMVSSALDFARGEAADEPSQPVDLAALLESVCDNATDMGLPAAYDWRERLVCGCRPSALKRALANVVENAARYGGRARVSAARQGCDLMVVVDDDGPGIPEAEMEAVFTPFHRLEGSRNRRTGGIGLGLTVARTIIRSHGGELRLENRSEGGLRATVTLPQGEAA
jgi:signal transduction histidine kinase